MYNIISETNPQSRFDARYWMLGAGAPGWPRGMVQGGRREEGSGWGTHVYLWQIHFDIWQNQYNIVKLNKKKFLKEDQLKAIKNWTEDLSRYFSKEGRQIPSKHMQIWLALGECKAKPYRSTTLYPLDGNNNNSNSNHNKMKRTNNHGVSWNAGMEKPDPYRPSLIHVVTISGTV